MGKAKVLRDVTFVFQVQWLPLAGEVVKFSVFLGLFDFSLNYFLVIEHIFDLMVHGKRERLDTMPGTI
jgi:hypothetical protein